MKIYFCDLCNESIPLQDLKDNKASTIQGKLFCGQCNPLKTVTASKAGGQTPWLVWGALGLSLAGLGVLGYQVNEIRRHDAAPELRQQIASFEGTFRELEDSFQESHRALEAKLGGLASQDQLRSVHDSMADQRESFENVSREMKNVREIVAGVQDARKEVSLLEIEQEELQQQLKGLVEAQEDLRDSLNAGIDQMLAQGSAPPPKIDLTRTDTAPGDSSDAGPSLNAKQKELVKELESKDPGMRWTAVDGLAETRDPVIVPYIVSLLSDEDPFVQMRVAMALGDLSARSHVKSLIPLLRDADPMVRDEVLEALIRLTGQTALRFDVRSDANAREVGVKNWEIWYRENKGRFES